jgi:hypothetical protein
MSQNCNSKGEGIGEPKKLSHTAVQSQLSFLQGKVLTIIDASFADERQLKAVKDLIKGAFHSQTTWITQLCWPELPISTKDELIAQGIDVDAVERGAVDYKDTLPA